MTPIVARFVRCLSLFTFASIALSGIASEESPSATKPAATGEIFPVDLSGFVGKTWDKIRPGTSWSVVPHGQHTLEGIPYQLDGVIEVTGMCLLPQRTLYRGVRP